ncbi:MAG: phosphotriesterase [Smithellaceae bacterium]
MTRMINTVCGPVSSDQMGTTLMHEHIQYGYVGWYAHTSKKQDREKSLNIALRAMDRIQARGVKTYVDATPADSGRDPEFYKEISEKSGVNIVCSTGLYTEAQGGTPYFKFQALFTNGVEMLTEWFIKEIEEGIGDTGVKAGVIKVATGLGVITDYEKMVLQAAARAQKKTGVPLISHTEGGTMGPEQVEILLAEGANPAQIAIGHAGGSADLKYHAGILDKGVNLAFDQFGIESEIFKSGQDKFRKASVIGLISMGYAGQLIFSHDAVLISLGAPLVMPKGMAGYWYPTHLFKNIIPDLKKAGITDAHIHTIMVENPRKMFEG